MTRAKWFSDPFHSGAKLPRRRHGKISKRSRNTRLSARDLSSRPSQPVSTGRRVLDVRFRDVRLVFRNEGSLSLLADVPDTSLPGTDRFGLFTIFLKHSRVGNLLRIRRLGPRLELVGEIGELTGSP